jgi:uncharacterized protein
MTTTQMTLPANPDTVAVASLDDEGWVPYDLAKDTLSGEPNTQIRLLRTAGVKTAYQAVAFFSSEPATFNWEFVNDEAFVLIEGHLEIKLDTGERFEMHAGDAISIPAGHTGVCEVFEPSRKFTVVTSG